MGVAKFSAYFLAINAISKIELFDSITANTFPHLKQQRRNELRQKFQREIKNSIWDDRPLADYASVIEKLKGMNG